MTNPLRPRLRRWCVALLALPLLAAGCDRGGDEVRAAEADSDWDPTAREAAGGVPAAQLRADLQRRLEGERVAPLNEPQWRRVRALYGRYQQSALWFDEQGLDRERVAALVTALMEGSADALRMDRYPVNDLARSLLAVAEAEAPTAEQVGEADLLLTATFAALGEDLMTGQIEPRSVSQEWHIDPQEEEVDSALFRVLRQRPLNRAIAGMRPQDPDYAGLRAQLARYREIAVRGGWPTVPAGRALKPGDRDSAARLDALRRRLQAEGLLPAGAAGGASYDRALAGAVGEYQARHGIVADSVLGPGTVASLNTPAGYRVGQIAASLERFRWLPRRLGQRYIFVNVPAFRLEAYDQGEKTLEMKVIVGEEYEGRVTPVFSDSMEYVVFRPYWLVTDDIAEQELLPKFASDPGALAAGNYELYQEAGRTRVRQKPGEKNSLGLVKFIFPNDFNIYLHDTPNDELFKEDVRAFSHGCIRLENPGRLAQYVLGWEPAKIQQAMQSGPDDQRVNLPRKIPVYITYFTAYMRNGEARFGSDLYQRDDALIRAIGPGAAPDAGTLRTLDSLRRFVAES